IQNLTGSTSREASTLVKVGVMLNDAEAAAVAEQAAPGDASGSDNPVIREPWLTGVGAAVARGAITMAAAEAIRAGLGSPTPGVTADALAAAAAELLTTISAATASAQSVPAFDAPHADNVLQLARAA